MTHTTPWTKKPCHVIQIYPHRNGKYLYLTTFCHKPYRGIWTFPGGVSGAQIVTIQFPCQWSNLCLKEFDIRMCRSLTHPIWLIFFKFIPSASYLDYKITWFDLKWTQKNATAHAINKPYALNGTNIIVYHIHHAEICSMETSKLYLLWMQFPRTFYVWILMWKRLFFPEIFVSSNGAKKPVLVSVLCCCDQQCIFI